MNTKTPWHALSTDQTLAQLQSSLDGLTNEEAARRLAECGPNETKTLLRLSSWALLVKKIKSGTTALQGVIKDYRKGFRR